MVRSARNAQRDQTKPKVTPAAENTQQRAELGDSPIPVRTLIFIEVGTLAPAEARQAVAQVSKLYGTTRHPTFVCPVRNGKLTTNALFEQEILDWVHQICDVGHDGKIKFKTPPVEVDVLRTTA